MLRTAQAVLLVPGTLYFATAALGIAANLISAPPARWFRTPEREILAIVAVAVVALFQLWSLILNGDPRNKGRRVAAIALLVTALIPAGIAIESLVGHLRGRELEVVFSKFFFQSIWSWLIVVGGPSIVALMHLPRLAMKTFRSASLGDDGRGLGFR